MVKDTLASIEQAQRRLGSAQARTRLIIEQQQERLKRNKRFVEWARDLSLDAAKQ